MNIISKIISTEINKSRLLVKILGKGSADVKKVENVSPFGLETNVPKGYSAVYANTGNKENKILIGIFHTEVLTAVGESRLFSTDEDGVTVFDIHLKNDGTAEIGGNSDNMVRYSELEAAYNQLKDDHDDTVEKLNAVIALLQGNSLPPWVPVTNDGGAALQVAAQGLQDASESTGDIEPAKIEEIKTL